MTLNRHRVQIATARDATIIDSSRAMPVSSVKDGIASGKDYEMVTEQVQVPKTVMMTETIQVPATRMETQTVQQPVTVVKQVPGTVKDVEYRCAAAAAACAARCTQCA